MLDEEAQRKAVALFNELKDRVDFVDMHFMQSVGSSGLGEHVVIGLEVRCAGEMFISVAQRGKADGFQVHGMDEGVMLIHSRSIDRKGILAMLKQQPTTLDSTPSR